MRRWLFALERMEIGISESLSEAQVSLLIALKDGRLRVKNAVRRSWL
jgi:hypothetical protein